MDFFGPVIKPYDGGHCMAQSQQDVGELFCFISKSEPGDFLQGRPHKCGILFSRGSEIKRLREHWEGVKAHTFGTVYTKQ
jgi:hypothetical protein